MNNFNFLDCVRRYPGLTLACTDLQEDECRVVTTTHRCSATPIGPWLWTQPMTSSCSGPLVLGPCTKSWPVSWPVDTALGRWHLTYGH